MTKQLTISALLLACSFAGFSQVSIDKYVSLYDSTGTVKAYFLLSDTTRINNAALLPPGTAVPLFDESETKIGQYILDDKRGWVVSLDKKQ